MLAAYAVAIGPIVLFAVVFFGGPVLTPCLGLLCPPPVDGPIPIDTVTAYVMACYVLELAWFLASVAVTWIVIRGHSDRTGGLLLRAGIGGAAVGAVPAVTQLAAGDRLRSVATTGISVAFVAAIALWVLGAAIVVWRSSR